VLPIRMPSLAERQSDIPELSRFFARSAAQKHGLPPLELSAGATSSIAAAVWPGNVRQLSNSIEAAAIRAAGQGAERIESRHVFPAAAGEAGAEKDDAQTFQQATSEFQRRFLAHTLDDNGWNISETARQLDLARSHVYNLIKTFGLERKG
jgi:DNA-binding NtrC family response regulator